MARQHWSVVLVSATIAALLSIHCAAKALQVASGRELALALADNDADRVTLSASIFWRLEDWDGILAPVLLLRNVTIESREGAASLAVLDFGDWGAIRAKFRPLNLTVGVITFRRVVLQRGRVGSTMQAPGLDIFAAPLPGEAGLMQFFDSFHVLPNCFSADLERIGLAAFPRPPMFPPAPEVSGGPTLQSFDVIEDPARMPGSRGGQACVNDTEAPPLQRCYIQVVHCINFAIYSSDAVVGSSTVQNGYMMNCLNHTLLCPGEVPRECMRQYDPVLCGIFFRSTPPPAAGGPRLNQTATALPLPPAAEPSSSDIDSGGSGGGDTLAIALGVSLGGAAALALAALGVVMWRRRDKGHKAAPADAAGKDAARLAAAAAAASATSSDPPTHAPAGKGEVFIEVREKDLSLAAGDNSDPLPSTTTIATPPLGLLALMGPGGGGGGGGLAQLRPWQVQDAGDQHLRVSAAETSASAQVNVLDGSGNGCGSGGGSGSGGSGGGGGIGAESDASAVLTLLPSVLGRGGAGSVLEGRYRGAPVAVKVLSWGTGAGGGAGADGATDEAPPPTLLAAFQAEVEALSRCQHPNIVSLLAVCTQPPRLCLVMERLDCSLDALIYQGAGVDRGLIPLPKVLHIAHQVCCGLAYLHPHTVHRDLSPANVLLRDPASPRPTVKLGDFGLARTQLSTRATRFPEVGSLGYIAPEAYDASNNVIRHYADVYALGVMLWAMLTGQVPWEGHSEVQVAVLVALQRKVPPLAPLLMRRDRCPPRLFELLAQCWDYEPERRPAAAELAKELLVLQELVERGLVGTGARGMSDDGSSHVPISNSGRTLMRARASFI